MDRKRRWKIVEIIEIRFAKLCQNRLLFYSLLVSLAGVLLLFAFSGLIYPKFTSISNLPSFSDGDYVSFVGYLKQIKTGEPHSSLILCDSQSSPECVTVVASEEIIPLGLVSGNYVSIRGILRKGGSGSYVSVLNRGDILVIGG